MSSKSLAVRDRLERGWAAEREIRDELELLVGPFLPSGETEDTEDKIDGYLRMPSGRRLAVQIKARENGNDIICEVSRDGEPGRDMVTAAELYVCRDMDGAIHLIRTEDVKFRIGRLMHAFKRIGSRFDRNGWFRSRYGSLRKCVSDRGGEKVVAFLSPEMFGEQRIEGSDSVIRWRRLAA
jgi:hypothetical protein